ncbi:MAG: carboxypeptidase regulatory-like domain-containing protein [Aequorivita sp.]|nr:carboxypeptidase regulatory-like domain-containing protein [Aequorivita sp.]
MKQNFLKFLLLLTVLTTVSCLGDDVDIENNRRLLIKGKVTDTQGNALPNIPVITSALGDALGQTTTDANGNFRLISLDEQFDPLDIFINVDNFYNQQVNQDYSSRAYFSQQHVNRVLYDMGSITLGKMAELKLTLNNNGGDQNTVSYEILYTPSACELPLNVYNPPSDCNLSEMKTGSLMPSSENQIISIYSIQGENVVFNYSLNSGDTQTIEIPLTNASNTYVFEY